MVVSKCYCDRCGREFETEYVRAFRLSNSFSLSNPSNIISGDAIFEMTLCHECEEKLLRWAGREDCIKRINKKPRPYRIGYGFLDV